MADINLDEDKYEINIEEDSLEVSLTEFLTTGGGTESDQSSAASISFDDTDVGFTSTEVQDAIEKASGMDLNGARRFGDIAGGNITEIEPDGTMIIRGDATVWEDIAGSLIGKRLFSNTGKIDFDYDENTLVFQTGGDITNQNDRVVWNYQYPHKAKPDGELRMHIHYEQTDALDHEFTIRYRIQDSGEIKVTTWEEVIVSTLANNVFPYISGTLNQIVPLVAIDMSSHVISSQVEFRLARTDNNGESIHATFVDGHYEIDTLGSNQEFVK